VEGGRLGVIELQFWCLSGGAEEKHEKPRSGYPVWEPRLEARAFRIRSYECNRFSYHVPKQRYILMLGNGDGIVADLPSAVSWHVIIPSPTCIIFRL
jgi:hypothetical protein